MMLRAILFAAVFLLLNSKFQILNSEAQNSLSLTVTPPLFQVTISPGQVWRSAVKVVNVNDYELAVYATPVNFVAQGEGGAGRFLPIIGEGSDSYGASLAGWIDVPEGPITISAHQSANVPFSIAVPENAPPGGHYAAILVGQRPAVEPGGGPLVSVSTLVSSLLFLRVPGDVRETGEIREFFADKDVYTKPEVKFALRFENKGNVHLQPQGDVAIYNMWGQKRGTIPINQKTDFGNVLPSSIRKFAFDWRGEENIFEAGRYRAIATLSFGSADRQNITSTDYFWMVPVRSVVTLFAGAGLFILLLVFGIRVYVRRALALYAGVSSSPPKTLSSELSILAGPLHEGIIDLRGLVHPPSASEDKMPMGHLAARTSGFAAAIARLLRKYVFFFGFTSVFIILVIGVFAYLGHVLTKERTFEVVVHRGDQDIVISSEAIIKERLEQEEQWRDELANVNGAANGEETADTPAQGHLRIELLNGGGIPGAAATAALALENSGSGPVTVGNAASFGHDRTSIAYRLPEFADEARAISEALGLDQGPTEPREDAKLDGDILVILGTDYARGE